MIAFDFLQKNKIFYLATVDGAQPHVRALGFVMEEEGKLAFCTNNQKEMFKQMAANPLVEICCLDSDMNTLRITGNVGFITTPETQKKALDIMPQLSNMYSVNDGKFEIFCVNNAVATCYRMDGSKENVAIL